MNKVITQIKYIYIVIMEKNSFTNKPLQLSIFPARSPRFQLLDSHCNTLFQFLEEGLHPHSQCLNSNGYKDNMSGVQVTILLFLP